MKKKFGLTLTICTLLFFYHSPLFANSDNVNIDNINAITSDRPQIANSTVDLKSTYVNTNKDPTTAGLFNGIHIEIQKIFSYPTALVLKSKSIQLITSTLKKEFLSLTNFHTNIHTPTSSSPQQPIHHYSFNQYNHNTNATDAYNSLPPPVTTSILRDNANLDLTNNIKKDLNIDEDLSPTNNIYSKNQHQNVITPIIKPRKNINTEQTINEQEIIEFLQSQEIGSIIVDNTIPEGFEKLFEPQETIVDIFFGDKHIGHADAITTPSTIKFLNPSLVSNMIPYVKNIDLITSQLSGELSHNSRYLCSKGTFCDEFQPEIAGIIYDSNLFKVDIVVNPNHLSLQHKETKKYIDDNDSTTSNLITFSGSQSYSQDKSNNSEHAYNITANHFLSIGNNSFNTEILSENEQDFKINRLVFEQYQKDHKIKAGFFPTVSAGILSEQEIFGASTQSYFDRRTDLEQIYGTQIELFLPSRSQVNLYKNDRLLSSNFYEAGNQLIDSSALPDGAYDIDIEIVSRSGNVSRQTRFFIKSNLLPPENMLVYWAAIGFIRGEESEEDFIAKFDNIPLIQAGISKRIDSKLSLTSNLLLTSLESAVEFGSTFYNKNFRIINNFLVSTKQDYGFQINIDTNFKHLYLSTNYRKILQGENKNTGLNYTDFDLVRNDREEFRLNIHHLFTRGLVGFKANINRTVDNSKKQYSYGPYFRWNIFRHRNMLGDINADISKTNDEFSTLINFRLFFHKGHYSIGSLSGVGLVHESSPTNNNNYMQFDNDITWHDLDTLKDDLTISLRNNYNSNQSNSNELFTEYQNNLGKINFTASHGDEIDTYSSNLNFSLLNNGSNLFIGGREQDSSAIIVSIKGDKQTLGDTIFQILIGNTVWREVQANEIVPIILSPFESYLVKVKVKNSQMINISPHEQLVTLYPGSVSILNWHADPLLVLISTLISEDNIILANAKMKTESEIATSDESGFFQSSFVKGKTIEVKLQDGRECIIDNSSIDPSNIGDDGIVIQDYTICRIKK